MGEFDLGLLDAPCLLTGYGGILSHSPGCPLSVNRLWGDLILVSWMPLVCQQVMGEFDLGLLDVPCLLTSYGGI